jgi:hypothetical protein
MWIWQRQRLAGGLFLQFTDRSVGDFPVEHLLVGFQTASFQR